jgi:lipocalin-like protein
MRFVTAPASILWVSLAAAGPAVSVDDGADELVGVWKLRSFSLQVVGEQPKEVFGPYPVGYLIFTAEGRMMTILTRADRKPAATVEESAALLQSMVAYTGRYTVERDRIVTKPDVAWNEIYSGTEQVRYYTLTGDSLAIRTAPQPSGVLPGRKTVGTLTYERERRSSEAPGAR